MLCPRCGHELDTNQSPCWYCGFVSVESSSDNSSAEDLHIRREGTSPRQRISAGQPFQSANDAPPQKASQYFKPQDQQEHDQRSPLQTNRFITNSLSQNEQRGSRMQQPSPLGEFAPSTSTPLESQVAREDILFSPGALLRGDRYRLTRRHGRQQWANGAYELHWDAQDLLQGETNVFVCEIGLPEMKVAVRQTSLRTAMRALFSASMQPRIPTLTNVFRESGRDFFVFETIEGETLFAHMQRTGQTLQEQDAIECCLQLIEVLEAISRQEPPLVHGLINPEHVLMSRNRQWSLAGFSVILASGAKQYLTGLDPSLLSPFTAPEFIGGVIDSRSDMYSLLATAYYGVTGKLPQGRSRNIPGDQQSKARVSPSFEAILKKGLHPIASQRYQQFSTLRQDLLALRSINGTISMNGQEAVSSTLQPMARPEWINNAPPSMNGQRGGSSTLQPMARPEWVNNAPPSMNGQLGGSNTLQPMARPERVNNAPPSMNGQLGGSNTLQPMAGPERVNNTPSLANWQEELNRATKLQASQEKRPVSPGRPGALDPVAKALSSLDFLGEPETLSKELLPRPEELPPIQPGNDTLAATFWMIGILICLLIPILVK